MHIITNLIMIAVSKNHQTKAVSQESTVTQREHVQGTLGRLHKITLRYVDQTERDIVIKCGR